MLVFRIEFSASILKYGYSKWCKHIGPYAGRPGYLPQDTLEWLDELCLEPNPCLLQDDKRHPSPSMDMRLQRNLDKANIDFEEHELCFGFPSLQKLSKWFDSDERCYLDACGFICIVYETDTMIPGNKQCVFDIHKSTPTRFIRLVDIY